MERIGNIIPDWAREVVVGEGTVEVDETFYQYHLLHRDLQPTLPGFVGFSRGEFLFASDEIPEDYLPHILRHEVREFKTMAGISGRCLAILKRELGELPEPIRAEYLKYRLGFFRKLVEFYSRMNGATIDDLKREITASLGHLESLVE